jgi:hypothetical protein
MTNNLVKRLRFFERWDPDQREAADRIEELEAALRKIETLELDPRNSGQMWVEALRQIARAAIKGKKDD